MARIAKVGYTVDVVRTYGRALLAMLQGEDSRSSWGRDVLHEMTYEAFKLYYFAL